MGAHTCALGCVAAASLGIASQVALADPARDSDPATLRSEIDAMKRDYEARLRALEERAEAAERRAAEAAASQQPPATPDAAGSPGAGDPETQQQAEQSQNPLSDAWTRFDRTFNPSISAILQGRAAYLQGWRGDRMIPGFPIGAESDRGPEGLALAESELVFSANVDDKLYGFFDVSFDQDDIEIEEAYLSTLSLPLGLGLKAGRFLSGVGYLNERHSHTWDFVDSPLVYDAMLNGSLSEPGLQLSWVAPSDLYIELGGELLRGDAFPAAGAENHGFGGETLFAKFSGDLGESHSWKSGLSYLRAEADRRESTGADYSSVLFNGSTDLVVAEFVWKWAPLGNFRERNLTFAAEYMHRHESGRLTSEGMAGSYRGDADGFYVQGVYQFVPRWRVGLRYGQLWGDNHVRGLPAGVVDPDGAAPRRVSTMVDFSNSEFSRLRLQYSFASGGLGDDSLVYLQYIISIGSHGAHAF